MSDFIAQASGALLGRMAQARLLHGNPIKQGIDIEGKPLVVFARINHGRWLADCPAPYCAGAEVVCTHDTRFFCESCGMDSFNGCYAEVIFPKGRLFKEIERMLLLRGWEKTRNWEPHETTIDLFAQNAEHGIIDLKMVK